MTLRGITLKAHQSGYVGVCMLPAGTSSRPRGRLTHG